MKNKYLVTLIVSVTLLFPAKALLAGEPEAATSMKGAYSYLLGNLTAKDVKDMGLDIDLDVMVQGYKDTLAGGKLAMDERELMRTLVYFQAEMAVKKGKEKEILIAKNKKESDTFLAENKKKEGVKATASGLQYKVLKEGSGHIPTKTDAVRVHYTARLTDGATVQGSQDRGSPAFFSVDDVIPGLEEALTLMKTGSKWQLFIPPHLAYGEKGSGDMIAPGVLLIYDIELVSILKPEK